MTREVVVTGIGLVTPLAIGVPDTWAGLLDGRSGAGPVSHFDPDEHALRSTVACEVTRDLPNSSTRTRRNMGRFTRMALVAAREALSDAALEPATDDWPADRVGMAIGTGFGGIPEYEAGFETVDAGGRVSPRFLITHLPNLAAGHLGIEFDARGPTRAPATACAAGSQAIADATDDIRRGRADVMIAGGAESAITPTTMVGFDAMRALSTRTGDPAAASRPFDADRDGFVMGEGAGILILESREHAETRGGTPLATIAGVGLAGDAVHPTQPPSDAHGLRRAMRGALTDAGLEPATIDHVNAHATATPQGDAHEATAISRVLGHDPPVWAPKAAIGHALGAAGAIETALTVRSITTDIVPPTLNYRTPDPDCPVTVASTAIECEQSAAICNAAGFGGTNTSLLLRKP